MDMLLWNDITAGQTVRFFIKKKSYCGKVERFTVPNGGRPGLALLTLDNGTSMRLDSFTVPWFYPDDEDGKTAAESRASGYSAKDEAFDAHLDEDRRKLERKRRDTSTTVREKGVDRKSRGGVRTPERREEVVAVVREASTIVEACRRLNTQDHKFISKLWRELGKHVLKPSECGYIGKQHQPPKQEKKKPATPNKPKRKRKPRQPTPEDTVLIGKIKALIHAGMGNEEAAKELGTSARKVKYTRRAMLLSGECKNRLRPLSENEEALKLIRKGIPDQTVADRFGYSKNSIWRFRTKTFGKQSRRPHGVWRSDFIGKIAANQ